MSVHKQTRGLCAYCGSEMTRSGMARHLGTCKKRAEATASADKKAGAKVPLLHLQVQDSYHGIFWLHLEMNGTASLEQLDHYLRAIWLECCGHMSQFSIGGWRGEEIDMNARAAQVFRPGVELTHIYDFGTESVTLVKAVDVREGTPTTRHAIVLMARNASPPVDCQECGRPATYLCMECVYEEQQPGTLCEEHAESHPHEEYGEPMPLVNSPRTGMCGYNGPAEPPY